MPYPHKFIKLTREQQWWVSAHLQRLAIEGKDRERNHLMVIHLSNQRLTYRQIMKRFGDDMSYMTVRRCVYIYEKHGISHPYFMGKTTMPKKP